MCVVSLAVLTIAHLLLNSHNRRESSVSQSSFCRVSLPVLVNIDLKFYVGSIRKFFSDFCSYSFLVFPLFGLLLSPFWLSLSTSISILIRGHSHSVTLLLLSVEFLFALSSVAVLLPIQLRSHGRHVCNLLSRIEHRALFS
ncbi:MAG: hypothetical protein Ct9H90mP11_09880 [Acidimicrobiales bacterium]|nr:MAG: hypothetical protein Ct9H90mP11_09880 [Acidimicrobiales bacterium]